MSIEHGMSIGNVVLVGSGPAGYTAALYLARAGLNPIVLTSSVEAGGALVNTTEVENFPGFPDGIMGPDLMENMRRQAERFGARLVYDDATHLELTGDVKTVTTGSGVVYRTHAVILAMGSAYRKLGVDGEQRLTGRGVSWCATCDGFFFRGQDIAVIGGGDSALEEAMFPLEATGDEKLTGLDLRNTVTGEVFSIDATGLFIAIGHDPRNELVLGQVDVDDDGYVLVDSPTTHTNISGVFACGDLVDHRYRQAIRAAGTGCAAAGDTEHYPAPTGLATYTVPETLAFDETALV